MTDQENEPVTTTAPEAGASSTTPGPADAVADTATDTPTDTVAGRPRRRPGAVVIVLAVALLVSLVALALVATDAKRERDRVDAASAAQQAARTAVVAMTSYDYATVESDFGWVDDAGTTRFRKQYAEVSAPIKKLVVQLKAHAVGKVVDSAVRLTDDDHATVLLFVDQTLTNPGEKQPGVDQPRVTMKMVRQDGRWLVDQVELHTASASAG